MLDSDTPGKPPLLSGTPGVHKSGPEAGSDQSPSTEPASGKSGIVMGLDPSLTATAIFILDGDGNEIHHQVVKTKAGEFILDRYEQIVAQVSQAVDKFDPSLVVIEGLGLGYTNRATSQLDGLHFVIRWELRAPMEPETVVVVPPMTLKKWVCGKGNARKELMLMKTLKRWGLEFYDDNLCDAYCLARWGLAYLAGEVKLPPPKKGKRKKK